MNTTEQGYNATYVRDFYDRYAEREWKRLEDGPSNRANFHVHNYYLSKYAKFGDHVLEAGAGPGRFTIELARIGARITVGDISARQLQLNREKVDSAGVAAAVESWRELDITDLSSFANDSYDAVVCYGGPLSYVMERDEAALAELLRVTKPGGYLLLSVMSLAGTARASLAGILDLSRTHGIAANNRVIATGDLDASVGNHICHMYRWSELAALLGKFSCTIEAASASNFLSAGNDAALRDVINDQGLWSAFLDWEVELSQEPGSLDGGTHIIAVVRKN